MQLVEQPEQRLRQHFEHAVVLYQFQAWCQGGELVLFLRTDEELVRSGRCRSRRERRQGVNHADRVHLAVDLLGEEFARTSFIVEPGAGEIMLHHGDPAVVGGLLDVDLALVDVGEFDLAELGLVGISGRAGEGRVKARAARASDAVAHQLHIDLRGQGSRADIDDFMFDADDIVAALEGIGLDQLDAVDFG